jgi:hypothetical protein
MYDPVLAFFCATLNYVVFFVVLCQQSQVTNAVTTTVRLVISSQQHNRFLNNVKYSDLFYQSWPDMEPDHRVTGSDVKRVIESSGQKSYPVPCLSASVVCVRKSELRFIYGRKSTCLRSKVTVQCPISSTIGRLWSAGKIG